MTETLEAMARRDLDRLLAVLCRDYQPGALEAAAVSDPAWWAAIERAEREVGRLYDAMRDADETVARWHEALADLRELWGRVAVLVPAGAGTPGLDRAA